MKRCLSCGYDLRTVTRRRCPECARPFDPDDPRTFIWARSPDALAIVLIVLSGSLAILFWLQRITFAPPLDDHPHNHGGGVLGVARVRANAVEVAP